MQIIKFSAILFCLMLCTSAIQAQRFNASILAGVNLSQIDGDDLIGYNRLGINVGGKVAAVLTKRLELNFELLYSQKGSNRNRTDSFRSTFDDIRLNFVEVPVYISFSDWKFKINAGMSYGRLIDYSVNDFVEGDVTESFDFNSDIFSFIVGATYYFRENFGLNIRWSNTLSNIQADPDATRLIDRTIGIRFLYQI